MTSAPTSLPPPAAPAGTADGGRRASDMMKSTRYSGSQKRHSNAQYGTKLGPLCYAFLTKRRFPLLPAGSCALLWRGSRPRRAAEGVAIVSEDNHLAPPGSTLLNISRPARPAGPGEPAGTVRSGPAPRKPATSEPSWGRVLATTIKLWVLRARGWRAGAVIAATAAVTVAVLAASGVFTGTAAPAARARAAGRPPRPRPLPAPPRRRPAWRRPRPRRGSLAS